MIKSLFISNSVKVLIVLLLFVHCSKETGKQDDDQPEINNCIISNLDALEEIQLFPEDNAVNQIITGEPVDSRSDAIINLIGTPGIHADFGSGLWEGTPIGIPFILVCNNQTKLPVVFRANDYDDNYGDESDPGPYPIPLSAPIEGLGLDGDSHVLAVDLDNLMLYELYNARANEDKKHWEASGGAVWDLKTNDTRPFGWTSADAAGLPILPYLVRYDEILKGVIDHPIRFTLTRAKTTQAFTPPANHKSSGDNTDSDAPTPYGMRLRLKADFDISGFSATNQVILNAMKNYGLIFADIGSDFYISGAPDERWDNDDLRNLRDVKASDFEVVQIGTIYY
ncbi:MAG: hypothetical protein U0W24_05085 [Bacteroidales bacterium]